MASSNYRTDDHPFLLSTEEVARQLGTDVTSGLIENRVKEIQVDHPPNEFQTSDGISWWKILFKQCSNAMMFVSAL